MVTMTSYPEPPEELRDKEFNSTTLKQCGWCKYASGSHRYTYCIEGSCRLIYASFKLRDKEVHWDTECILSNYTSTDIQQLIEKTEYRIKESQGQIQRCRGYIKELEKLKEGRPWRPPLPDQRKYNHFNIDDKIACWYEPDRKWYFGEVKKGYRHQDGCVSYRLDGLGPQERNFWGCGTGVPTIILRSEFDWFANHSDKYLDWMKEACDGKEYNGKTIKMPRPPVLENTEVSHGT
jgi:hypothetical protein